MYKDDGDSGIPSLLQALPPFRSRPPLAPNLPHSVHEHRTVLADPSTPSPALNPPAPVCENGAVLVYLGGEPAGPLIVDGEPDVVVTLGKKRGKVCGSAF